MHGARHVDHVENIVELSGVSFSYGEAPVLHDISFAIHRGDYVALIGGNGAGKTTLLKIMLGLLEPEKGSVKFFGTPLAEFKDRRKIGYVPQKTTSFENNFPATVFEVALMGRYGTRGLFKSITDEDRAATRKALEEVGMLEHKDTLIGDLSGGQQQRVFIARALAGEPEVIFLDEPTTGIEKRVRDDFYTLLRRLNQEKSLTIVLVTHNIEGIAHDAMHIACIEEGGLYFHNSLAEYIAADEKCCDTCEPHVMVHTHGDVHRS